MKVLDKSILIEKLEKSHSIPTNKYIFEENFLLNFVSKLTKDLNDILQTYLWFEETKDLFGHNKDFEEFSYQLESLEIREMEADFIKHQYLDTIKFNHKDFFKVNNKRLFNLLEFIVKAKFSNENPIKMTVLERLINKGKELNFRDNQTEMVKNNLNYS